jgi:prephenate dehydrogenase
VESVEDLAALSYLVILAAPVDEALQLVERCAATMPPGAVLTDVGSVKSDIVAAFDSLPEGVFGVGGHPMSGSEQSGVSAARPDLFHNATWAMCPSKTATVDAIACVAALAEAVGARPVTMAADDHDRLVAATSHLPYATGLALALAQEAAASAEGLYGGGIRDATRLARGSVPMWEPILRSNRRNIVEALGRFESELHAVRTALEDEDPMNLRDIVSRAARAAGKLA